MCKMPLCAFSFFNTVAKGRHQQPHNHLDVWIILSDVDVSWTIPAPPDEPDQPAQTDGPKPVESCGDVTDGGSNSDRERRGGWWGIRTSGAQRPECRCVPGPFLKQ